MAHSDTLRQRVQRAEKALTELRKQWYEQMIAESPLQVGDLVKITTPNKQSQWDNVPRAATVKYGRVRELKVEWGNLHTYIAPPTRNGFHARTEIHVEYGAKVEKVNSIPTVEVKG